MKLTLVALVLMIGSFAVAQDKLGTIQASALACPAGGVKGTACYALDIACPNIANYTAYAKISEPASPIGTVLLTAGGNTTYTYEDGYKYGLITVQDLVKAKFTTVQLTFGLPFSASPGWQFDANGEGVRAASCRYATVVQWVYNLKSSIPLCATGSSAGGQQIAEGLAHYGLGNYLKFAEITSGPPFNRVDLACINNAAAAVEYCSGSKVGMGVGDSNAVQFVDPAYPGPWCSTSLATHSTQYAQEFLLDSVTSPDGVLSYPNTKIRFLFGGLDTSSAIRQGLAYQSLIAQPTTYGCVKDAPHSIPDVLDGAQTIAADLIKNCHK